MEIHTLLVLEYGVPILSASFSDIELLERQVSQLLNVEFAEELYDDGNVSDTENCREFYLETTMLNRIHNEKIPSLVGTRVKSV